MLLENENILQNLYHEFNNCVMLGCRKLPHRDPHSIANYFSETLLDVYNTTTVYDAGSLDETFRNAVVYMADKLDKDSNMVAEDLSKSLMDNFFESTLMINMEGV